MLTLTFDTLKLARRLQSAGFTEAQAEVQVEIMADALALNTKDLVTRDYLDARLAELKGRMGVLFLGQGLTFAAVLLPQIAKLLQG